MILSLVAAVPALVPADRFPIKSSRPLWLGAEVGDPLNRSSKSGIHLSEQVIIREPGLKAPTGHLWAQHSQSPVILLFEPSYELVKLI